MRNLLHLNQNGKQKATNEVWKSGCEICHLHEGHVWLIELIRLVVQVVFSSPNTPCSFLPSCTHLEDDLPDKRGPVCNQGYISSWTPLLEILYHLARSVCRRTRVAFKILDTSKPRTACSSLLFIWGKIFDEYAGTLISCWWEWNSFAVEKIRMVMPTKRYLHNPLIATFFTIASLYRQWRKCNI